MLIPEPVIFEYQKPPANPRAERTPAHVIAKPAAENPDRLSCLALPRPLPNMTRFIEYASNALEWICCYSSLSVPNDRPVAARDGDLSL
jgi:hypothetical protein